jgi:hypothetical protein
MPANKFTWKYTPRRTEWPYHTVGAKIQVFYTGELVGTLTEDHGIMGVSGAERFAGKYNLPNGQQACFRDMPRAEIIKVLRSENKYSRCK